MKRFYKETAIDLADGSYRILLDGRPMRTPAKAVLIVPTRPLAEAIAAEWAEVPDKAEINVSHLPLTRLAATGHDRVTTQRARVIEDTAKYARSDMLCYRASEPETLARRQQEIWQPLLDWAADHYGARLVVVEGLSFIDQPEEAVNKLHHAVAAHSDLGLSALYNLTHISGSLVVALAVAERHLSPEDAFAAAQLDELYQIERWGQDPIAAQRHQGIRRDIDASARFLALLAEHRLKG